VAEVESIMWGGVGGGGSSHCCGGGGVDDAETPQVVIAAEARLMMSEPLEPLLRWRWGQR
jgi:hypothetical protein